MSYGIHWFRRDLRVAGNVALQKQFKKHDGRVVGIFCFDKKFLARDDFSVNRFQFFLETLRELKKELRAIGSDLLIMDVGPDQAFKLLFEQMKKSGVDLPSTISWSRDYEPFAVERDDRMKKIFDKMGVDNFDERDHLLIEPQELEKGKGEGYQVYSPFARKWLSLYESDEIQARVKLYKKGFTYLRKLEKGEAEKVFKLTWKKLFNGKMDIEDHLDEYIRENSKKVDVEIPPSGSVVAWKKILDFKTKIDEYGDKRDFPQLDGTSKLSMYLKNGSITVPQIIAVFDLEPYQKKSSGRDVYLSELIWREFYYHILARFPNVEHESFLEKYRDLNWGNNKKWFEAWKEGKTGFPIVDAGMRELKETGWMHNRVRMIVASFLTKDLLIDWKWGEKYFMDKLLDGDLAPNNGGWQWAASTGCDPQPYFRIFNPWLQSKKFDPDGVYIKKFIPELANEVPKNLHQPIIGHHSYPAPIVDHSIQRDLVLLMYKQV
jgi:deoxyribodipyrimidine photo-lyase